jgi:hypothetical protein
MKLNVEYRPGKDIYQLISLKEEDYCCSRMKEAWLREYIGFGYKYGNNQGMNIKHNLDVNIYTIFDSELEFFDSDNDEYIDLTWWGLKIDLCPFCGEKIEINIKEISLDAQNQDYIEQLKKDISTLKRSIIYNTEEIEKKENKLKEMGII